MTEVLATKENKILATSDVTVVGLGPMNRAMARSLIENGHSVMGRNRGHRCRRGLGQEH